MLCLLVAGDEQGVANDAGEAAAAAAAASAAQTSNTHSANANARKCTAKACLQRYRMVRLAQPNRAFAASSDDHPPLTRSMHRFLLKLIWQQ